MCNIRLVPIKPDEFENIYAEMEKAFPECEMRTPENAREILNKKEYTVYGLVSDGNKVGFLTVWEMPGFVFAEHFVIYKSCRNRGYGSNALKAAQEMFGKMVLEAETPDTDIARRRLDFYKRNGFCINEFRYVQPPYRPNGQEIELKLLSFPEPVKDIDNTVKQIHKTVYGKETG